MNHFPTVIGERSSGAERWRFCFSIDGVSGYQMQVYINYKDETALVNPVYHEDAKASTACPFCGLDANVVIPRNDPLFQTYCLWALENNARWKELVVTCLNKTALFFVTNRNIYLGSYRITYNQKARYNILAAVTDTDTYVAVNKVSGE